jgi:OOP family OmpA-OmpF porin
MILRWTACIAALAALAIPQALSQNRGIYVGASYGGTDYGQSVAKFDDPPDDVSDGSILSGTVDNRDNGWSLLAGYRLGRYFALEGGWTDLGEVQFRGKTDGSGGLYECPGGPAQPCDVTVTSETDGFFVVGVGTLPLGRFGLFGQLGFYARKSDFRVEDGRPGAFDASTDSAESMYGVGVEYRFDGGPTVRIEWEKYTDIVTIFNKADVDYYSAGLVYQFTKK